MEITSGVSATIALFVFGTLMIAYGLAGGRRWQFGDLRMIVAMLVETAEQTMPGDSGEAKLAFVLAQCEKIGVTKWIPVEVLRAMIESAVYRLKGREGK